jgi:hypothetical protein
LNFGPLELALVVLALVAAAVAPLIGQSDMPATTVQAKSAGRFVGSMGVNVHVESTYPPYCSVGLVHASLESLRMQHIRDEMNAADPALGDTAFIDEIQEIGELNYTLDGVIEGGNDYPTPAGSSRLKAADVVPMITSLLPVVDAVEGPNEPDDNPPPFVYDGVCDRKAGEVQACYPDGAIQEQEDLWHIVKHSQLPGSEKIKNLPVLGMSEGSPQDFFTLAKASGSTSTAPFSQASYGNMHAYQGGQQADWHLTQVYIPDARAWTGSKTLWTTEMGYHNYTKFLDNGEQQGVSERAAAIYLPIAFLSGFNNNIERTFSYELFDEVDDPKLDHECGTSAAGIKYCSGEGHYGLVNFDGTVKPAFTALHNLIEILSDSGSKEFTPGKLDIRFSGAPKTMGYMLLQKSDGEYYLAIWNDELVYSTAASGQPGYDIYQKNVPVTIQFCMPRTFTVYAPNDETGTNPTDAYTLATGSDSIQIDLPAKVLLIKVVGGS